MSVHDTTTVAAAALLMILAGLDKRRLEWRPRPPSGQRRRRWFR
jgi:hypothetical protein